MRKSKREKQKEGIKTKEKNSLEKGREMEKRENVCRRKMGDAVA